MFWWRKPKFRMLWELEQGGRLSWLVGTAHFFPRSFRQSLERITARASCVLFEGPLDEAGMQAVVQAGRAGPGEPGLAGLLEPRTLDELARVLGLDRLGRICLRPLGQSPDHPVRALLAGLKPWMGFFTLWTVFLEHQGWRYSVDLEAYRAALGQGRPVVFLESIEEQIAVLESLPLERILKFLDTAREWPDHARSFVRHFLAGDAAGLPGGASGFPSRTSHVIGERDRIFAQRMAPYLERGGAAVFLGMPHVLGVSRLLEESGVTVRRAEPC